MNQDKHAIITGATSGIGTVIVDHLVKSGFSVFILGRSQQKLTSLVNDLTTDYPQSNITTIVCELGSIDSTTKACNEIKNSCNTIDLLVLNAGLWNFKYIETKNNIEETLHVNLLSQFLIFDLLKDLIPREAGAAKVIFTSSGLHQGEINFDDIEFKNKFSGFKAYRQSKLGSLLLTRWLAKQPDFLGISFYCVHPGMVNTQLGRSAGWLSRTIFKLFGISKEKGAQTHIHLISKDSKDLKSGEYYAKSKVTKTTPYSYDLKEAEKLWHVLHDYMNKYPEKQA